VKTIDHEENDVVHQMKPSTKNLSDIYFV
jgi:hypothetical protein